MEGIQTHFRKSEHRFNSPRSRAPQQHQGTSLEGPRTATNIYQQGMNFDSEIIFMVYIFFSSSKTVTMDNIYKYLKISIKRLRLSSGSLPSPHAKQKYVTPLESVQCIMGNTTPQDLVCPEYHDDMGSWLLLNVASFVARGHLSVVLIKNCVKL